ncbi:MAG: glutamylcysteine synthetase [Ruminococcus sp.]|nr:glutamylcysteine synthetase [Ruminococcus sp.]
MRQETIDRAIYDKYISRTLEPRPRRIGIEIEMPVVDLAKAPVEESVVFAMAEAFREHFGFEPVSIDANGQPNSMADPVTGDDLSFDCSYSNLELSMGKGSDLFVLKKRFEEYYRFINRFFAEYGYTLTGMGINPHFNINRNQPVPNERYRMLYHYLHSYKSHTEADMIFHDRPDFGTFTSASQVQIDVSHDELIDVINVFGLLEPYKSLLFANSYLPEFPDLLCSRNMLWERSMQGYNPHNVGMFEYKLRDTDDLLSYIKTQSIYCTMRDGKYIDFTPIPVIEFFDRESVTGEYFDGNEYKKVTFSPVLEDLEYLRTFKFEDLTFRGTIEFRSSCCQPIKDSMTVAAFHIGLLENVPALKELLENDDVIYGRGYSPSELQRAFSMRVLPVFADKEKLSAQLTRIVRLAEEGLVKRGKGEEELIRSLYDRAARLTNPAREMVEGIESGASLEDFILRYAQI